MIGTPSEASQWPCPASRLFAEPRSKCRGPECPWWRWKELDVNADPRWAAAVAKIIEEMNVAREAKGQKRLSPHLLHGAAVAKMMPQREALGLPTKPTHGYCGAGGEVKA